MLIGINGVVRIATEIELKYTNSGKAYAKFAVVGSKKYKTDQEQKEDVCFINCVIWGKLSEVINQFCHKGSKIFIRGELKQDKWQDKNGNNRSAHSINVNSFEMLDSKKDDNSNSGNYSNQNQQPSQNKGYQVKNEDKNGNTTSSYYQDKPQNNNKYLMLT